MIPFRFVKAANVSVAGTTINAPGSANMPGAGYTNVGAGAASIPGMSIHCLKCGGKLKHKETICPKCGNDCSKVATEENGERMESSPDVNTEVAESKEATRDWGKYGSFGQAIKDVGKGVAGGAALVGAGMLGMSIYPKMKKVTNTARQMQIAQLVEEGKLPPEELEKIQHLVKKASRMGANPILSIRQALKKLRKASGKARPSMVFKR